LGSGLHVLAQLPTPLHLASSPLISPLGQGLGPILESPPRPRHMPQCGVAPSYSPPPSGACSVVSMASFPLPFASLARSGAQVSSTGTDASSPHILSSLSSHPNLLAGFCWSFSVVDCHSSCHATSSHLFAGKVGRMGLVLPMMLWDATPRWWFLPQALYTYLPCACSSCRSVSPPLAADGVGPHSPNIHSLLPSMGVSVILVAHRLSLHCLWPTLFPLLDGAYSCSTSSSPGFPAANSIAFTLVLVVAVCKVDLGSALSDEDNGG
jgi:hypothetical protein